MHNTQRLSWRTMPPGPQKLRGSSGSVTGRSGPQDRRLQLSVTPTWKRSLPSAPAFTTEQNSRKTPSW